MREIRFRAFLKEFNIAFDRCYISDSGQVGISHEVLEYQLSKIGLTYDEDWQYITSIDEQRELMRCQYDGSVVWFPTKECIPMQLTERKDKNGTNIIEGDILERSGHFSIQIKFDNGLRVMDTNSVRLANKILYTHVYDYDFSEWEIVGNIYETPELLKTV